MLTDAGPVEISVPRDRDSSFQPEILARRQRRLTRVDQIVISLSAKGLTNGEIAAHLAGVYDAEASKQTITTIADAVMDKMADRQNRPLDAGRIPLVVANPGVRGFGCPGMRQTRCLRRSSAATSS